MAPPILSLEHCDVDLDSVLTVLADGSPTADERRVVALPGRHGAGRARRRLSTGARR